MTYKLAMKILGSALFILGLWAARYLPRTQAPWRLMVRGHQRVTLADIHKALGQDQATGTLNFGEADLSKIHERLAALPWVQKVSIRRLLPNTCVIHIQEQQPLAIWQYQGHKQVMDTDGHPIDNARPKDFPTLLVLTGHRAVQHFPTLLPYLPLLAGYVHVKGASFLRSQRWNIYGMTLSGHTVCIKLPHDHIPEAITKMTQRWPQLSHAQDIDLRFADVIILDPAPSTMPSQQPKTPHNHTQSQY